MVVGDLALADGVDALLAAAGPVEILVANAALPASGRIVTLQLTAIERAIAVNLTAPIALTHALAPAMVAERRGHIVFVGSLSAKAPSPGASVYAATKAGLRGFALGLRAELAYSGVGVSLVSPG